MTKIIICLFISLVCIAACSPFPASQHSKSTIKIPLSIKILNASEAAEIVIKDKMEGFFEKITMLEMAIQMKKSKDLFENRSEMLGAYKIHLQNDLGDFTAAEKKLAKQCMQKALELSYKIDTNFSLPKEIQLIKTKGKYYGPGVYYTRNAAIIIPEKGLNSDNAESLTNTLIHEIFHIYSRYNPHKRKALYQRIGYEYIEHLKLNDFLNKRILYNPDGVDLRYAITVEDDNGRTFKAIPAIYSKHKDFQSSKSYFFHYLVFQLFEVVEENGIWQVSNASVGLFPEQVKRFFEQIGSNTNYIIHPDEVLADNFQLLALSKENSNSLDKFSVEGQQLLTDIEHIIKQ